ncbi:MAG TPA: acyl carrier protein [Povalibacter sp.]|nr:acyl carrier protein [Povalibacter sp.]
MSPQDVSSFLCAQLRSIKPTLPEVVPTQAHYRNDLCVDSLDLVELVARIEQRFGFPIVDADLSTFVNLDATTEFILNRIRA